MRYCGCCIGSCLYVVIVVIFLNAIDFYTPVVGVIIALTMGVVILGKCLLEKETKNNHITREISSVSTLKIKRTTITDKDKKIFKECWLYTDFIKKFGNIKEIRTFINSNTEKPFKSCIINTKDKSRLYLNFSSSLGELTLSEITKRKEELKVGLTPCGNYKLYDDSIPEWETIDFNELSEEKVAKEDNVETPENKENFNTIKDDYIQKLNHRMAESFRARGIDYDEDEVMNKYKELCQTVYAGREDYEVNLLTWVQKLSLFGLITLIGSHEVLSNKRKQVEEIMKDFADTIKLSKKDYDEVVSHALKSERTYIHIIKDIHLDYPINMLFDSWRELAHIDDSSNKVVLSKLITTAKELGFTEEESQELTVNRYIHKYS